MEEDVKGFWIYFAVSEVLGLVLVIMVGVWLGSVSPGAGFGSKPMVSLNFNLHPFLMALGFIFLYGNSIMIYRILRNMKKMILKIIHAVLHFVVLLIVIVGLTSAFDFHDLIKLPHLYSLHSWIGIGAVAFFALQWTVGLIVFLVPVVPTSIRSKVMSYHIYFGLFIFTLSVLATMTGLVQKTGRVENYSSLPKEGMLINFIGVFLILYAASVIYITTNPKFKRYPRPDDGAPLAKNLPANQPDTED